jgi:hypothetical protein
MAGFKQSEFETFGIILGISVAVSLAIAIVVGICLNCYPEIMVIGMSFTGVVVILATGLVEAIAVESGFGAYFFGLALVYGGFVCYYWDTLLKAAILMKTVGRFILESKKILLIIVFSLFYCIIVLALWVLGLYSFFTLYSHGQLSYEGFTVSFIFWIFTLFFFNFYFYYTSVFLTS